MFAFKTLQWNPLRQPPTMTAQRVLNYAFLILSYLHFLMNIYVVLYVRISSVAWAQEMHGLFSKRPNTFLRKILQYLEPIMKKEKVFPLYLDLNRILIYTREH